MGFLDRLLGRPAEPAPRPAPRYGGRELTPDEAAVERYTYLLRTAPPDQIEQAHAEAFAQLTPDQRREVLRRLSAEVPPAERSSSEDPQQLARMATRAEMRRPGTLERSFGGGGGGIGMGGLIAGGLLSSIAGAFIGTAIADAMFDMSDAGDAGDASADTSSDASGDAGDASAADAGGDYGGGDFGGDFGGGDFGGF
jgi:hypothetical protein